MSKKIYGLIGILVFSVLAIGLYLFLHHGNLTTSNLEFTSSGEERMEFPTVESTYGEEFTSTAE